MLERLIEHVSAVCRANQVSGALSVIIQQKKLITYKELAEAIGVSTGKMLCDVLANVAKNDYKDSDPISSAVVVSGKYGIPAKGFFEYANKLGFNYGDKYDFWIRELVGLGYGRDDLEEVILPEILDKVDLDSIFDDSSDDEEDNDEDDFDDAYDEDEDEYEDKDEDDDETYF